MDYFRKVKNFRIAGSMIAVLFLGSQALGQANLEVEGLGWLGDRQMDERLGFLLGFDEGEEATLDAPLLEDSAFLLLEQMRRQGYLKPTIRGVFLSGEEKVEAEWETPYKVQLPIEYTADHGRYVIERGRLFYYAAAVVEGLEAIDLDEPERFFIPGGSLLPRKKDLAFTQENLKRRKNRLISALKAMGYADARFASESVGTDDATGAVELALTVEAGPLHRVDAVTVDVKGGRPDRFEPVEFETGVIFNREWAREARVKLRNAAYAAGFPDVKVHGSLTPGVVEGAGEVRQAVRFELVPGSPVELGDIRFDGDPGIKRSVLRRQADLKKGVPLDPRRTDRARRRLMGLGIFQHVEMDYEPLNEDKRAVIYRLTPAARKKLQLLAGWGSYEQARAGFRWTHKNPWGRAHRYSARAKQSFKATRLQSSYNIPQILGTNFEAYSEAEYSTREEIGYDRSRQGVLAGVSSVLGASGWRMALEYGWFAEEADGIQESDFAVVDDALVSSLGLSLTLDRRDDPLAPTSGYDLFARLKTANRLLGGNVNYQRLQMGGSFHQPLTESTILHLALRGGMLIGSEDELPFGERFFPGGENTVRGFREGEASPLSLSGDPVGAESFWRGNIELEERIFRDFSLVVFFDAVGVSRDGGFWGDQEVLNSLGLGLRYKTVVGPVRLEYGHNLNPREQDRDGSLHFSIGYPF